MGGLPGHVLQTKQLMGRGNAHPAGQVAAAAAASTTAPAPATAAAAAALQTVPTSAMNPAMVHGSHGHKSQVTGHGSRVTGHGILLTDHQITSSGS